MLNLTLNMTNQTCMCDYYSKNILIEFMRNPPPLFNTISLLFLLVLFVMVLSKMFINFFDFIFKRREK
jgi:hypothetical protein